jgi:hypothetical protein
MVEHLKSVVSAEITGFISQIYAGSAIAEKDRKVLEVFIFQANTWDSMNISIDIYQFCVEININKKVERV